MNIGEAAAASDVSAKMIRHYEFDRTDQTCASNRFRLSRLFRQRSRDTAIHTSRTRPRILDRTDSPVAGPVAGPEPCFVGRQAHSARTRRGTGSKDAPASGDGQYAASPRNPLPWRWPAGLPDHPRPGASGCGGIRSSGSCLETFGGIERLTRRLTRRHLSGMPNKDSVCRLFNHWSHLGRVCQTLRSRSLTRVCDRKYGGIGHARRHRRNWHDTCMYQNWPPLAKPILALGTPGASYQQRWKV